MAISYQRTSAFPISDRGVGGGTPLSPQALDPRGLVPVDRVQPVATDNFEPQRMMERRLGTMPPSSFAGAGAGFVPALRPSAPGVQQWANQMTDVARAEQQNGVGIAPTPPLSAQAVTQAAGQAKYAMGGGMPVGQTDRTPVMRTPPPAPQDLQARRAERQRRIQEMLRSRLPQQAQQRNGLLGRIF